MSNPVIVVHYHELWLKGRNRRFFLRKLCTALRVSLQGIPVERIEQPGDRVIVWLGRRRVAGEADCAGRNAFSALHSYAVARAVELNMEASVRGCVGRSRAAAVRDFCGAREAQRQIISANEHRDWRPPSGGICWNDLRAQGRDVRVRLNDPEMTCYVEIAKRYGLAVRAKNPRRRAVCLQTPPGE